MGCGLGQVILPCLDGRVWHDIVLHIVTHGTGTIIVNRCRLEKTINKVSIAITRVNGSCDWWWCMDRPTTRKYDFTSKTFGDLIQPKNCEISNSGGNIFCWLVSLLSELKTQDCRVCSLVLNVQIIVSQLFVRQFTISMARYCWVKIGVGGEDWSGTSALWTFSYVVSELSVGIVHPSDGCPVSSIGGCPLHFCLSSPQTWTTGHSLQSAQSIVVRTEYLIWYDSVHQAGCLPKLSTHRLNK